MMPVLLALLAFGAALGISRYTRIAVLDAWTQRTEAWLSKRGAGIVALVSIAVVWFVWDALVPVAKVHDESSYLLQARIFASGRWTAPSPPIPEFFEQPHVLVQPVVASKYPPGHALLLATGALVGFPPLVPLLLTGLTAALTFALASRLANASVALMTWAAWITAPIVLRFQPSYFSELTTTTLLLASWWMLLRWRESAGRERRWLPLIAVAIGWGAITRPLTMLALALPIGVVVLRDSTRLRRWRDLALALVVGVAVLSILPVWNARTTGDWRQAPLELYRRDYLPYDKMGFTADTTPPGVALSPVMRQTYDYFLEPHMEQTVSALPRTLADRAVSLVVAFFQGWRLPMLVFAIVGLFLGGAALRFAAGSAALLFVAHLAYAYHAPWTLYYLETAPVLAAMAASGAWHLARRLRHPEPAARMAVALVTMVVLAFGIFEFDRWRRDHRLRSAFDRRFAQAVARLPAPAIVFMQYSPRFAQHLSVVQNHPDLRRAPVWVVHDLGPRNADLRRLAPERASFDFDEAQLLSGQR